MKKKSNKRKFNFIFLFYLAIFLVTLFIFDPKTLNLNFNSEPTVSELNTSDKKKEFDFILDTLKSDYPYLELSEKNSGLTIDNISEEYKSLISNTKNDVEYEKVLHDFFSEFKQDGLFFITPNEYFKYKSYFGSDTDSPWSLVLNDENVLARYEQYSDEFKNSKEKSGLSIDSFENNSIAYIKIPDFNPLFVKGDSDTINKFMKNIGEYGSLIIDIRDNDGISIDYIFKNIIEPLAHNTLVMDSIILEKNENHSPFLNYFDKYDYITIDKEFYKTSDINVDNIDNKILNNFQLFRKYNIKLTENPDNKFTGKIYVLQNNKTENAADFLSQFSNVTNFADTVGQFTKGNGVNLNNAFIKLPYSNFLFSMPVGMGINEDGSPNAESGTYPEIVVDENTDSLEFLKDKLKQEP